MKEQLINEFNKLGITDMEEVKELHEGKGSFVNLEFPTPCGQFVKLWDNDKTYYINQLEKRDSTRCYGLTLMKNICWFANMEKAVAMQRL